MDTTETIICHGCGAELKPGDLAACVYHQTPKPRGGAGALADRRRPAHH